MIVRIYAMPITMVKRVSVIRVRCVQRAPLILLTLWYARLMIRAHVVVVQKHLRQRRLHNQLSHFNVPQVHVIRLVIIFIKNPANVIRIFVLWDSSIAAKVIKAVFATKMQAKDRANVVAVH